MMYSTTFRQHNPASQTLVALSDLIARVFVFVQSAFSAPAPTTSEASAQLLKLADAYESTQPSYAADLRAAAAVASRD